MSNELQINCFNCGRTLNVPRSAIGRTGKCPACKTPITIEAPAGPKRHPAPPQELPPELPPEQLPELEPDDAEVVAPPVFEQPTHREEIGRDRNRILTAISNERDKYRLVEPYLMDYEQPIAIAVQRQFPFSIFSDIVLLSSHRLMMFTRFFTKITMFDVNYVDVEDVTIQQGFFTSALTVVSDDCRTCTIKGLITDQALSIYRMCQDLETKARIARRRFQLEENRSKTTQMQINNQMAPPPYQGLPQPGPNVRHLGQRDISNIGDEEKNPFRLGE